MPEGVVVSLPRVRAAQAGIEAPLALLDAGHERMRHALALLGTLVEHLRTVGHDADARGAARELWRFFEIDAPGHQADEERHLLPRLRESGDLWLADVARRLQADHAALGALWQQLGPLLREASESVSAPSARALDALHGLTGRFVDAHQRHLRLEDRFALPALRERAAATSSPPAVAATSRSGCARPSSA